MIFRQWEAVLSGDKTQTRRLKRARHYQLPKGHPIKVVKTMYTSRDDLRSRTLWVVGKDYAVQPPGEPGTHQRGGKSVGRIRIKSILVELLQDISDDDLIKEGFVCYEDIGGAVLDELQPDREAFTKNWDDMYRGEPGAEWDGNPLVYVIDFEKA